MQEMEAFEYLSGKELDTLQEVANLGLAMLAEMKLGDNDGEYQPAADDLVTDLQDFITDAVNDSERNPDDPIIPNIASALYGFAYVWSCGYRWAKNPLKVPFAAKVVVSPDERYYLAPLDLIVEFMAGEELNLTELLLNTFNGELPEGDPPIQIQ